MWLTIAIVTVVVVASFVLRALWRANARRSGEIVEVRSALPEGEVDAEIRALVDRRYRLELLFEARTRSRGGREGSAPCAALVEKVFPYQLVVREADEPGGVLYERSGFLQDLFAFGTTSHEPRGTASGLEPHASHWGSLPLLEFESGSLRRLRIELSIPEGEGGLRSTTDYDAHLDKASLVVKEDVRPLPGAAGAMDRVVFEASAPI